MAVGPAGPPQNALCGLNGCLENTFHQTHGVVRSKILVLVRFDRCPKPLEICNDNLNSAVAYQLDYWPQIDQFLKRATLLLD